MKRIKYGGLAQIHQEVSRGSSRRAKKDEALFQRPSQTSLSEYDRDWHDQNLISGNRAFVSLKPVIMAFILCIGWIALHESLHYAVCVAEGGRARMTTLSPYPSLACDIRADTELAGSLLYYLSPYIAALIILFAFSDVRTAWLRLISYAAFYDTQYNLFATTVFGGRFGRRGNDLFLLIEGSKMSGQAYGAGLFTIILCVLSILVLSLTVFYRSYAGDFRAAKSRRFYLKAAGFFTCFYALSLAGLYLRWPGT